MVTKKIILVTNMLELWKCYKNTSILHKTCSKRLTGINTRGSMKDAILAYILKRSYRYLIPKTMLTAED